MDFSVANARIGIIGLGYVGLPLAVEFGKKIPTVGFDINEERIKELLLGYDLTLEVSDDELTDSALLTYSSNVDDLKKCNVYIVTVPTPIDSHKQPDLTPLINASYMLGDVISVGDIVIYESTVYPGATEEECIPVIEKQSELIFNTDFFAGYSPERINPGDKSRRVTNILKVTSGSNAEVADFVDELYNLIIKAGTHKAPSIKVAEASKVIENVQRDVNIALINELYHIFERMDINTSDVIEAASTKWNFMKLSPGLVGGHCIGVDPYYLLHKSNSYGYIADLMRSAREVNDGMPDFIANLFMKKLLKKKINPIDLKVLMLGFTFKENCPDIRNTKVKDLYDKLIELGFDVKIYDPWINKTEVYLEYGINVENELVNDGYDVGFLVVPHDKILEKIYDNELYFEKNYIFDFKGVLK